MKHSFSNKLFKTFTIFFFTLIVSYIFHFCIRSTEPLSFRAVKKLPSIEIPWDSTNSVVCFGTSLTYGFILNGDIIGPRKNQRISFDYLQNKMSDLLFYHQADSAYPHCLDNKLRLKVYNQGYVGATVENALEVVQDSVFNLNPALILLEFAANDFLMDKDVNETEERLCRLIDKILTFGSKVVLISFVDEYTTNHPPESHFLYDKKDFVREYYEMLKQTSEKYKILFIDDCFFEIFYIEEYMSDSIHPNEMGYKKMADNITISLMNTFLKNKMLL